MKYYQRDHLLLHIRKEESIPYFLKSQTTIDRIIHDSQNTVEGTAHYFTQIEGIIHYFMTFTTIKGIIYYVKNQGSAIISQNNQKDHQLFSNSTYQHTHCRAVRVQILEDTDNSNCPQYSRTDRSDKYPTPQYTHRYLQQYSLDNSTTVIVTTTQQKANNNKVHHPGFDLVLLRPSQISLQTIFIYIYDEVLKMPKNRTNIKVS